MHLFSWTLEVYVELDENNPLFTIRVGGQQTEQKMLLQAEDSYGGRLPSSRVTWGGTKWQATDIVILLIIQLTK